MKKHFLKSFALVAMLFSALNLSAASGVDWSAIGWIGSTDATYNEKFKCSTTEGLVNIQHPGFASEIGIYMTFPAAGIECNLSGISVQGAGIIMHLSSFTAQETEVTVTYAGGSRTFWVYYADGTTGETPDPGTGEGGEEPEPTPDPEEPEDGTIDWESIDWVADSDNKFKVYSDCLTAVINVQQPGWANEKGIYVTVPAGITECSVNGAIDGAGMILYLSSFTAKETEVTITHGLGSCTFWVYYADGTEGGGETPSTPTEIYDVNFALASNGSSAEATSGDAAQAIDNNSGSRWESAQEDPQTWTLDLGQARIFNTLEIVWEGAYGKTFTVSVSDDKETWTPVWTVEGQQLAGFPYTQTQTIDKTTARYIQFHGTERGTGYGYSFWEFRVYLAGTSTLTSLEATPANGLAKVGEGLAINVTAKDQNGKTMANAGEVTYTITPVDAGTITDNVYTPAKIGSATIFAAIGEVKAAAFDVFAYDGENVALSTDINTSKIMAQSDFAPSGTDAWHAIDGNEGSVWQGSATNGGADDEASRTYESWFIVDFGAYYDINLVSIKFEGACSQEYTVAFSANNATWSTAYEYVGNAGVYAHTKLIYGNDLQNNTKVRYARFYSTKAATQWGVKMFEFKVFGTPGEAPADDEKPVMIKAELVSNTFNRAIIAVEATDNNAVANYKVVDASNALDQSCTAKDGKITVSLEPATEYTLTISAVDLAGNISENSKEVRVITPAYVPTPNVAAPVPNHDAKDVLSIYSDAYSPAWTTLNSFNENWWQAPSMEEKEIGGDKFLRYHALISGGMVGWQFAKFDASGMTHIHVDIWPSISGEIKMGPTSDGEGGGNPVASVTLAVVQEQWNSFDIPVTDLQAANASFDLTKVFQNQFTEYSAQTEFSVDNVYFWKPSLTTSVENTEATKSVDKVLRNGVLYIIRNGVTYDVMGRVVR